MGRIDDRKPSGTGGSALKHFLRITELLAGTQSLPDMFLDVLTVLSNWTGASFGAVWEVTDTGEELHLLCSLSLPPEVTHRWWLKVGDSPHSGIAGRVAHSGKPLVISDYDPVRYPDQPPTPYRQITDHSVIRAVVALPLLAQGERAGVIELFHDHPLTIPPRVMTPLRALAPQWGAAIRGIRRDQELRRRSELTTELRTILRKSWGMAETSGAEEPDKHAFFTDAVRLIGRALDAEYCALYQYRRADSSLTPVGFPYNRQHQARESKPVSLANAECLTRFFTDHDYLMLRDITDDDEARRRSMSPGSVWPLCGYQHNPTGPSPLLIARMRGGLREVLGLLVLRSTPDAKPYDESDSRVALEVADTIGSILEGWNLHQSIIALAKKTSASGVLHGLASAFNDILEYVRLALDADWIYMMEFRPGADHLQPIASAGRQLDDVPALPIGSPPNDTTTSLGINVHVFRSGRAYYARSIASDKHYRHFASGPQAGSEICVPMKIGERDEHSAEVLGTVCASSRHLANFDYAQVGLLWSLSSHLALLLKSSRTLEELGRTQAEYFVADVRARLYKLTSLAIHDFYSSITTLSNDLEHARADQAAVRKTLDSAMAVLSNWADRLGTIKDLMKAGGAPVLRSVSVKDVLRTALPELDSLAQAKGVKIFVNVHGDHRVLADDTHLTMVLLNIVRNAIQASYKAAPSSGHEGHSIWISSERVGDNIIVRIEDEGPGFPKGVLEKFADGPVPSVRGGGIGLWLSWSLVRMNNGELELSIGTTGRKGSIVTVSLRAAH